MPINVLILMFRLFIQGKGLKSKRGLSYLFSRIEWRLWIWQKQVILAIPALPEKTHHYRLAGTWCSDGRTLPEFPIKNSRRYSRVSMVVRWWATYPVPLTI